MPTGMITTFDVKENKVDVSPVLEKIKLPNTPLLNAIGVALGKPVNATKTEWWDDERPILGTTLGANYVAAAGSLTIASSVGMMVGTILKIGDSIYRVTEITDGTHVAIAIVAGDANHSNGDEIEILSNAALQGEDYKDSDYSQKIKRWNMTQIFHDYIKMSGTQLEVQQYVQEDVFKDEVLTKLQRMYLWLEKTIINGIRVEAENNTTPNLMGGIRYFIGADGITSTAAFSETNFKTFLKSIQDAGGSINQAWMNPLMLDSFLSLNESKLIIDRADQTVGRVAKAYISNYGTVSLNVDNHIPAGEILIFDTAKIAVKPLKNRAAFYQELAKTGDNTKGQLVGEYTLEFRTPDIAGMFKFS